MAEIPYTFTQYGDHAEVKWEAIEGGDTGQPFPLYNYNDNTVTISGTFDSNTLTMQGANYKDLSDVFTLTDNNGLSIAVTAAGGRLIAEAPYCIRPSLGSGASSDINVKVQLRKS